MGELPQRFPESLTVSILDVSSAESIAAWASDLATKVLFSWTPGLSARVNRSPYSS